VNLEQAVAAARQALGSMDTRRTFRPAVVAHDIWLASGLETMLPETVLMCVQRSSAVDVLRQRGIDVFCLSEHVSAEEVAGRSSAELLEHPRAVDFCHRNGPLAVMTFKPSERFEAAVRATDGKLVAGRGTRHMATARSFENKLNFVDIAIRAGLRTPRWEVVTAEDLDYPTLAVRFGESLVVQGPRGNAGQRTWLVSGEAELEAVKAREGGNQLRVAELLDGMPFTVNAVADEAGLLDWIPPSRQVTGVPWLTPMPLGSCGNAWGERALDPHLEAVGKATAALGDALGQEGFSGVFGVDFVDGAEGPAVIETNPRMVASLPLATQLELEAGRVPLLLRALLLGLGVPDERLVAQAAAGPAAPALTQTSQLIVHRLETDPPARPLMPSGVYLLRAGEPPVFLRPGAWLSDVLSDDEALLLAREPREPVTPAREFARVYVRGSAGELTPGVADLVGTLRGT
jgi:hypothetical protein